MNRLRIEGRTSLEAAKSELGRIERQIKAIVDAIADGMYQPSMKGKMDRLEDRKAELERRLAHADEPSPLLHPEMATFYREQVAALHLALGDADRKGNAEAAARLRSLVSKIVLTPESGNWQSSSTVIWLVFWRLPAKKPHRLVPMGLFHKLIWLRG